jgi:hypothetical protein
LQANQDAARDIETSRYAIAHRASVLRELIHKFNEMLGALPPELREQMEEWAKRVQEPEA